jgi:DNA-binding FadR family transcriptional regulator
MTSTTALPEEVAEALVRDLADRRYRPGDRLPTEQALAARFGVSRAVVREAISRLKSDGLVVSQRGSGLFAAATAPRSFRIDAGALADRSEILAVFELREAVEEAAAALAAERRGDEQLAAIARAHAAMEAATDWGQAGIEAVEADIAFHRAIAEATGNARFTAFVGFLGDSLAEAIRTARAGIDPATAKRVTVAEHARILAAIAARNPRAARRAARAHLRGAKQRLGL